MSLRMGGPYHGTQRRGGIRGSGFGIRGDRDSGFAVRRSEDRDSWRSSSSRVWDLVAIELGAHDSPDATNLKSRFPNPAPSHVAATIVTATSHPGAPSNERHGEFAGCDAVG